MAVRDTHTKLPSFHFHFHFDFDFRSDWSPSQAADLCFRSSRSPRPCSDSDCDITRGMLYQLPSLSIIAADLYLLPYSEPVLLCSSTTTISSSYHPACSTSALPVSPAEPSAPPCPFRVLPSLQPRPSSSPHPRLSAPSQAAVAPSPL